MQVASRLNEKQAFSLAANAWRDGGFGIRVSPPGGNRSRHLSQRCEALCRERQRRIKPKGEEILIRRSYQQGYVSEQIRTSNGVAFRIRYRLHDADGKWVHKSETIYGLAGK